MSREKLVKLLGLSEAEAASVAATAGGSINFVVNLPITDEQIRELARTQSPVTGNCAYLCSIALGENEHPDVTRAYARALCAEILRKREGK